MRDAMEGLGFHAQLRSIAKEGKSTAQMQRQVLTLLRKNMGQLGPKDLAALDLLATHIFKQAPLDQAHQFQFFRDRAVDKHRGKLSPHPEWMEALGRQIEKSKNPVDAIKAFFHEKTTALMLKGVKARLQGKAAPKRAGPESAPTILEIARGLSNQAARIFFHQLLAPLNKPNQRRLFVALFTLASPKERELLADATIFASKPPRWDLIEGLPHGDPRRLEVAQTCLARNWPLTTGAIAKFELTAEQRIELADLSARLNIHSTTSHLSRFELNNPADRLTLALRLAARDPHKTVSYLERFKLEGEAAFVAVAEICGSLQGQSVAEAIDKFGISDQKALTRIAMLCASESGRGTAGNIEKFGIKSEEARFEIAKQCIARDPFSLQFLDQFHLSRPETRAEVVRFAIEQHEDFPLHLIAKFDLGKETLRELGMLAIARNPEKLEDLVHCGFSEEEVGLLAKLPALVHENFPGAVTALKKHVALKLPDAKFDKAIDSFANLKTEKPEDRHKILLSFAASLFFVQQELDPNDAAWVAKNGLLRAVNDYRRPAQRPALLQSLAAVARSEEGQGAYAKLAEDGLKRTEDRLTALIAANLTQQGVVGADRLSEGISFDPRYAQSLIQFGLLLSHEESLSPQEKEAILGKIATEGGGEGKKQIAQQRLIRIRAATALLLLHRPGDLANKERSILGSIAHAFREALQVGDVKNLAEKYQQTFGASRNETAIVIYAAKLSTLDDKKVTKALSQFATSVLNGDFHEQRYSLENSPHLQMIARVRPDLLEKWRAGSSAPLSGLVKSEGPPAQWLESHLEDLGEVPFLTTYLKDPSQEKIDELAKARRELGPKIGRASKEDKPKLLAKTRALSFQADLIKLASSTDRKEQLEAIKGLQRKLKGHPELKKSKFAAELNKLGEGLAKAGRPQGDLQVFDTDDPIELLLSGIIGGSCLSVEGNPFNSRGLLGILLNPWNRELRLAQSEDSPTVARCFIRLLWDGKQPVLLAGPTFPDTATRTSQNALEAMARQRAEELGIPLLTTGGRGKKHPAPLQALGGPSPFDYVDPDGLRTSSTYTVHNTRTVH